MHITLHTDYALRVLIFLAASDDRLVTIQEIAGRFDISRSHLMKVVNQLIRNGFVEGVRGKGGGLRLAQPPAGIRVGEVVRRMESDLALVECFSDASRCLLTSSCRLRGVLDTALEAFFASLNTVTLAELLGPDQRDLLQVVSWHPRPGEGGDAVP